jgi:putative endonuclease
MPVLYIIYSASWDQYYIGSTIDLNVRLQQHNDNRNRSTKGGEPWVVKYTEAFQDIRAARRREYELKKKKSRRHLEWLIASAE